ncbi:MAG: cellulase family glycosylhydrolase [Tannerellaceae bacterium]|nr:cellulase family glycosylhydrolase [Tannerellaceae bacterium]
MKNTLYLSIFLFSFLIAGLFACSDNDGSTDTELTISTTTISFSAASNSQSFHIKTNTAWTITSSESWCTVTPSSGSGTGTIEITLSVPENTTTDSRTATLTITAGTQSEQLTVTQSGSDLLLLQQSEYEITAEGGEITVAFQQSADPAIEIQADWITLLETRAVSNEEKTFRISKNGSFVTREGTIRFTVGALTETVTIRQSGQEISIPADQSGMSSDATTLAAKMQIGWNLGNSLEACNGTTSAGETMWGNPVTTKALIDAVKAAGFNTVRIPCAWSGYIEDESTYKIKDSWLARVKEVIDYCVDNDMYAIINIHWDGGWLEEHPFYSHQEEVNKKQKALWEQIAVYFRDYDEHLLFAGTNEVHADYNAPTTEYIKVQHSYNQTFVDAVRATGGRNAWRNLIIQAYNTNITYAAQYLQMPTDEVTGRLMAEVHYYDPYEFCLDESDSVYLWGENYSGANKANWGNEDWVDNMFGLMKTHFVDKGIPVVIGEYGAILRANLASGREEHIEARHYYLNYVTQAALKNGMVPVYWDNGGVGNHGFGLFDRAAAIPYYPETIQAITGVSL